jgi:hypothetical protein
MLPLGLQTDIAILVMTTIARHVIGTVVIAVKKHVEMGFTIVERTFSEVILDTQIAFRRMKIQFPEILMRHH